MCVWGESIKCQAMRLVFRYVHTQAVCGSRGRDVELNVKAVWGQFLVTKIPNAYTND